MVKTNKAKNELVNVSWRFGVTAATNRSDSMGKSFLHLKLLLRQDGGQTTTVFADMSISRFYKFLHDLERANANLASS